MVSTWAVQRTFLIPLFHISFLFVLPVIISNSFIGSISQISYYFISDYFISLYHNFISDHSLPCSTFLSCPVESQTRCSPLILKRFPENISCKLPKYNGPPIHTCICICLKHIISSLQILYLYSVTSLQDKFLNQFMYCIMCCFHLDWWVAME